MDRIVPDRYHIDGPIQITKADIQALSERIKNIENILTELYVSRQIASPDFKYTGDKYTIAKEKIINDLSTDGLLETSIKIEIKTSKNTKNVYKKYSDLADLIKDSSLTDRKILSLDVTIYLYSDSNKYINDMVKINVEKSYNGDLHYNIDTKDNDAFDKIKYEIEEWIELSRPKLIMQLVYKIKSIAYILSLILISSVGGIFLIANSSSQSMETKEHGKQLIESGINESNINDAVETLLKLEIEYYQSDTASNYIPLFIIWGILAIFGIIISTLPNTTIGLGKGIKKAQFNKIYLKLLTISIPLFIFGYIIERILNSIF